MGSVFLRICVFGCLVATTSTMAVTAPIAVPIEQPADASLLRRISDDHIENGPNSATIDAPFTHVGVGRHVVVNAPFTGVRVNRGGVRIHAPFVNLWIPK